MITNLLIFFSILFLFILVYLLYKMKMEKVCKHYYENLEKRNVMDEGSSSKYPIACVYILKCKHCGDIKSKKITG